MTDSPVISHINARLAHWAEWGRLKRRTLLDRMAAWFVNGAIVSLLLWVTWPGYRLLAHLHRLRMARLFGVGIGFSHLTGRRSVNACEDAQDE